MKNVIVSLLLGSLAFTLTTSMVACSSAQKVNYPPTANSARELDRIEADIRAARDQQVDLLAFREMARATKYLNRAERTHSLNDIGYARGYLNQAHVVFAARAPRTGLILKARELAVKAGAERFTFPARKLAEADARVHDEISLLVRRPDRGESVVNDYAAVRVLAVQETYLGKSRRRIELAMNDNARYYAPRTLNEAKSALEVADRAIAVSPNQPRDFADDVMQARRAAALLSAINVIAHRNAKQTDEQIARDLLMKESRVAQLRRDLRGTELEVVARTRAMRANRQDLEKANARLKSETHINEALSDVREKFSRDEADVYRDGDKLLIQLKQMDFRTGSAKVPERSKPLLSKVKAVISELKPSDVVVEGHADDTGPVTLNDTISKKRAESVANFIESQTGAAKVEAVGQGENHPIRSNKTKQGRAANRRVDVIVTPKETTAAF